MELNQLIGDVLKELELSKKYETKKNYLVHEVILELNVSTSAQGQINVLGIGSGNVSGGNSHKMIVKLIPKSKKL